MNLCLVVALLLSAVPQTTRPVDSVLERLAKVGLFAFGGTGYAGVISPGEKIYKIVVSRTSAVADFEKLYSEGDLQAKCYTLVGIHKLNSTRFEEMARPLRNSKEMVSAMHGCIVSREALGDVIKDIKAGKYGS